MIDALAASLIVASLVAGFAWGRISPLLPIPEWLRLATTPLWTGTLTVIAGWLSSVIHLGWTSPRVVHAATLGPVSVLKMALGYGVMSFLAGAALGLPATLGWAVGYRPPHTS
jgi:hypothetical protein